jgi:hypothetical protein
MKTVFHFHVEIPGVLSMTWFGGGLKPSLKPGHVWLTNPGGDPILEFPRCFVHPTTYKEIGQRILVDRRLARAERAPFN